MTGRPVVLHAEPDRYGPAERAVLDAVAEVDYRTLPDRSALREVLAARPYAALFTRVGLAVGADELAACPTLRWVVTPTTGLDHLDLAALERRSVAVISLRGQEHLLRTVHATAEHTWGLLLALARHTLPAARSVLDGRWGRDGYLGIELAGRTLGILGLGRLGRMVAGYGLAFGMEVLAHDVDQDRFAEVPGVVAVSDRDLLSRADVVSLHLPLDDTTRGYLSAERLALVRPGTLLVNTARGELVDDLAVAEALRTGRLGGAALDVVADDASWEGRTPTGQPLVDLARTHDNVVITPHIGGYGRDSVAATRHFVAERFAAAVRDDPSGGTPCAPS